MKVNYFVIYPNNTYEFVEKDVEETNYQTEFLDCIEDSIGDFSWSIPLEDYPGYFILINDCVVDYTKVNKLASSFTHKEECDICVLTKCYEGQACFNNEFETFSEDDKKYFEIILNEQIKVIENENTRSK